MNKSSSSYKYVNHQNRHNNKVKIDDDYNFDQEKRSSQNCQTFNDDHQQKYFQNHKQNMQLLSNQSSSNLNKKYNQYQDNIKSDEEEYQKRVQIIKKQRKYAYIKSSQLNKDSDTRYQKNQNDLSSQSSSRNQCQNKGRLNFKQKDEQIEYLKYELSMQKCRFQQFQQQTIQNQIRILQTITNLEQKLKDLKQENHTLKIIIQQKNYDKGNIKEIYDQKENVLFQKQPQNFVNQNFSLQNHFIDFDTKTKTNIINLQKQLQQKNIQQQQLLKNHKKIKGIVKGLIDMMKKVDGIECPQEQNQIKFTWKWIKKVVWEYEAIRKKALQWKRAYDELNKCSDSESQFQEIQYLTNKCKNK